MKKIVDFLRKKFLNRSLPSINSGRADSLQNQTARGELVEPYERKLKNPSFSALTLKTKGFKFSRDEANERR